MAITTKDILGTDSVSASRITINDNINTVKEAVNDVLDAFDTSTGKFDNSAYGGSGNEVKTKKLVVTSGGITSASNATITTGNLAVSTGIISIGTTTFTTTSNVIAIDAYAMDFPKTTTLGALTASDAGRVYYDNSSGQNKLKLWTGTAWETITSA